MPLVSVIIPAYNAHGSIAATLDSVLQQTLPDFEIIVSDDGSADQTSAVVSEYRSRDPRISYLWHENRGASHAKNFAVRHARGEYLTFLDADDALAPTALEKMVHEVRARGALWCWVDIAKKIGTRTEVRHTTAPVSDLSLAILIEDFVLRSPFYARSAFLSVGMYDETLPVREDWDVNIRMLRSQKPFAHIREPLYIYTQTENSLMTSNPARILLSTERVLGKHHKLIADSGDRVVSRIYAQSMWDLARQYFLAHDWHHGARCTLESLKYDFSLRRIAHPLTHRLAARFGSRSAVGA